MINTDRIVPIQAIDLISMYGLILKQGSGNSALAALAASTTDGQFNVTAAATPLLANEPVQTINIASGVSTATIYFVPAYDYAGFSINGTAVTPTGDVNADGRTLYKAALASGAITITQVGF
jgi:lipid-binding SYLF domain-containing protein